MDVLIPDLKKTIDVDLATLLFEEGLRIAENALKVAKTKKDKKQYEKHAKEARQNLKEWKPPADAPTIKIGYLPAAKRLELVMRIEGDVKSENFNVQSMADEAEDWVRWGVKGHQNFKTEDGEEVPFEFEEVEFRGRKVQIAMADTVELYRQMGILFALQSAVIRYNNMSAKKKSRSSPTSGDVTPTSGAGDAKKTRT